MTNERYAAIAAHYDLLRTVNVEVTDPAALADMFVDCRKILGEIIASAQVTDEGTQQITEPAARPARDYLESVSSLSETIAKQADTIASQGDQLVRLTDLLKWEPGASPGKR